MNSVLRSCPLCDAPSPQVTVTRAALPVLQNRVYPTREAALAAPNGTFSLGTCETCGFSYNATFDARLVIYDEHYDNDVPSGSFLEYYRDLARMMLDRFDLAGAQVFDVGCGKGTFLRALCDLDPTVSGVGVDPSCKPMRDGNFELVQDVFRPELFSGSPKLVLLRHVLEHLAEPLAFVTSLREAIGSAPLYIEVPDLDWIFANAAFWDFCYEHCNYFTKPTLARLLERAGFEILEQQNSFGGQYQWALVRAAEGRVEALAYDGASELAAVEHYHALEAAGMKRAADAAARADRAIIWGMATKGVLFSTILGGEAFAGGVDINPKKQNQFAPGAGLAIYPPEWLATVTGAKLVFAMNGNYSEEIRSTIRDLRVEADVLVP